MPMPSKHNTMQDSQDNHVQAADHVQSFFNYLAILYTALIRSCTYIGRISHRPKSGVRDHVAPSCACEQLHWHLLYSSSFAIY